MPFGMCYVQRIEKFLESWPDAEYGPAHCVLGDANIEDEHLDDAISECRKLLIDPSDDPERAPEEELRATLAFLFEFRRLPLEERVQPGDQLCT